MATKRPKPSVGDEDLPEDYYDTFHGRGQPEQDREDLEKGLLPSVPNERQEDTDGDGDE